MTAAAPMQGTYIPQYTPVPPTAVSIEVSLILSSRETKGNESQLFILWFPITQEILMSKLCAGLKFVVQTQYMKVCILTLSCLCFVLHIKWTNLIQKSEGRTHCTFKNPENKPLLYKVVDVILSNREEKLFECTRSPVSFFSKRVPSCIVTPWNLLKTQTVRSYSPLLDFNFSF